MTERTNNALISELSARNAALAGALRKLTMSAAWLQVALREAGKCIDGGACHHGCKADARAACFRQQCCAPLSGSGLSSDWKLPGQGS